MDEINISEMIEKELEEGWLETMNSELHGDHSNLNEDFRWFSKWEVLGLQQKFAMFTA